MKEKMREIALRISELRELSEIGADKIGTVSEHTN